jgi:hypothetical protein
MILLVVSINNYVNPAKVSVFEDQDGGMSFYQEDAQCGGPSCGGGCCSGSGR